MNLAGEKRFIIWLADKYHSEEVDGAVFWAVGPETAVEAFASHRYEIYQHTDPGRCWVRSEDGKAIVYRFGHRIYFWALAD